MDPLARQKTAPDGRVVRTPAVRITAMGPIGSGSGGGAQPAVDG
jgi:hypothetical protein